MARMAEYYTAASECFLKSREISALQKEVNLAAYLSDLSLKVDVLQHIAQHGLPDSDVPLPQLGEIFEQALIFLRLGRIQPR